MNFIRKLIQKTGTAVKCNLASLSIADQAKYIINKGKFIEKRTSGGQTLALYSMDTTYFELLSSNNDKVVLKVMELNNISMERFYGKQVVKDNSERAVIIK
jgi:hypothetical protein